MNYIVCGNCKQYVPVNGQIPLSFDKCNHCGHTLKFAEDEQELQLLLRGIELPKISYNKICTSCKSVNPRETGSCLYCGSTSFQLQYDWDSVNKYNESIRSISNPGVLGGNSEVNQIPNSSIFRFISLIIGVIDFIFFAIMGIQLALGDISTVTDPMLFAQQHFQTLFIILVVSLFLAGLLSIFVLPRMSYFNSFRTASNVGVVIGVLVGFFAKNPMTLIISVVACGIITGLGGLVGEAIIKNLTRKIGPS